MQYNDSGSITIRVYTAGGALPIAETAVRIMGTDEENRFVEYSLLTDIDGLTKRIALPSPSRSFSLSPSAPETPYANYDIEIAADGYYTKKIKNVAIFSGVNSIQEVNMIPISPIENGLYPRNNLDATVYENKNLEA